MTLQRNHHLVTTRGHSVFFKKGEPTFVPGVIVPDAVAIGAVMADGSDALGDEPKVKPVGPTDPIEREKAIFAAFVKLSTTLVREDFTAAGAPTAYAVNRELGWPIDSRERARAWDKFKTQNGE
jgi:hypothetical protein